MIRQWPDINFTAVYTPDKYSDVVAKFKAFEITSREMQENGTEVPCYWRLGATSSFEDTTNLDNAEPTFECTIKWDGCSHWDFTDSIHLCGKQDIDNLCQVMHRVWGWAKELGMDRI